MRSEHNLRSVMKRYVTLRTTLQRLEEESEEEQLEYDTPPEQPVDEQV